MRQRWIDGFWAGGLAVGVGVLALGLLPEGRRASLLLGLSAGATAGVTILRVRGIVERRDRQLAVQLQRLEAAFLATAAAHQNGAFLDPEAPAWLPDSSEAHPLAESPAALLSGVLEAPEAAIAWLHQRQIQVKSYYQPEPGDHVLTDLALLLGDKYDRVVHFYEQIKRHLSSGHSFQVNLAQRSPQDIADTTHLGHRLSAYALLASYRYDRKTKTIYATPPSAGQAINFFSGSWFERYALLKIVSLLTANQVACQCIVNPKVILPKGDDFEFDLLFWLADEQPLWVECKTGDYQAYITKYAELRKILGLEPERAVLLVLDLPTAIAADLSQLYNLTVVNQETFLSKIAQHLALTTPSLPTSTPPSLTAAQAQLRALLSRLEMRPLPQYRHHILQQLTELFSQLEEPKTLIEIKFLLANRSHNLVSKTKLQDILNVLVRRECFLGADGLIISSRKEPIARLVSEDVAVLEQRCVEGYAYAALASDPDYFEDEAKAATFAAVVGQPAPAPEAIAALQARLRQDLANRPAESIQPSTP